MELPKWKAELLVAWFKSGLVRRSLLVWNKAKSPMVEAGRATLAWFRRYPTALVALSVLGVIAVLLGPVLWVFGGWALIQETTVRALTAFRNISDPEKTVEAYGKLISAVGLLLAAPVGLLGVGLAFWRTWNQHRDGVVAARKLEAESYAKAAEAYAKAVEQLGNEKASVRMGATLALEALGKATPRLLSQTIEILCAFVREEWPNSTSSSKEKLEISHTRMKSRTELQLIIETIVRLKKHDSMDSVKVNLVKSNLQRTELISSKLTRANFYGADMSYLSVIASDFTKSLFINVVMKHSMIAGAKFADSIFTLSDLSESNFNGCDFSAAFLIGVNLENASLYDVNLADAKLGLAILKNTNLTKANLTNADMTGAKIDKTKFDGTIFSDTTLPDGRKWTGIGCPPTEALEPAGSDPAPSLPVA